METRQYIPADAKNAAFITGGNAKIYNRVTPLLSRKNKPFKAYG